MDSPEFSLEAPLTPKIHNKRRSLSLSTCENGSFDCKSLQRSLKRVRLTSNITPGELRLQRDLRHAVLNQQWVSTTEDEWKILYVGEVDRKRRENEDDLSMHEAPLLHDDEPRSVRVAVSRDEQDPMELILRIDVTYHQASAFVASTATTTLHLQFPRLYPHRPPAVRRIEYQHQQQQPKSTWLAENRIKPNVDSSSVNYCPLMPKLQRIIISASPDCSEEDKAVASAGTVVLTEWTPVSRLTDICHWLVDVVLAHHHGCCDDSDQREILKSSELPLTPTTCNCTIATVLDPREVSREHDEKEIEDWRSVGIETSPSIFWNFSDEFSLNPLHAGESSASYLPSTRFDVVYDRQYGAKVTEFLHDDMNV